MHQLPAFCHLAIYYLSMTVLHCKCLSVHCTVLGPLKMFENNCFVCKIEKADIWLVLLYDCLYKVYFILFS